jgi:splicing factor 4
MGAYLPKEELDRFLNKSLAGSGQPAVGAHASHKLDGSNVGHQMLVQQGWQEGQGLGPVGSGGIVNPVEATSLGAGAGTGVGAGSEDAEGEPESEFDQYRKRMQLAYRFRPNPMNNPRRDYY